ncbi:MAG: molybdate ABC transporter substrate-binding protein [Alterinioella nitratireducens]|uniref:molybdate ABC transporter substrate-binding protein n=1 Tax=Alterinioella nitratireducens TaxID=2735915 RepID=UPI0040583146
MDLTRRTMLGLLAAPLVVRPVAASEAILVFAASSLRQGLEAALQGWQGAPVTVSYAGTATLARQIEAGARADLFFGANADWAAYLEARELLDGAARVVLSNTLVLAGREGEISPGGIEEALAALPEDARIATGFVEAVPVGIYARQALQALGQWDRVLPYLVQTENTRVAAALAARGEVARALIYATDVAADPGLAVEAEVPADLHDPIAYPLAMVARGPHPGRAALFDYLSGPEALEAFRAQGFSGVTP